MFFKLIIRTNTPLRRGFKRHLCSTLNSRIGELENFDVTNTLFLNFSILMSFQIFEGRTKLKICSEINPPLSKYIRLSPCTVICLFVRLWETDTRVTCVVGFICILFKACLKDAMFHFFF